MNPERFARIEETLEGALARTGPERDAYLDRACANDPELRAEVESLLVAHAQAGSQFLNLPVMPHATVAPAAAGRRIGPYDIVEKIGSGGMGDIFAAVRADGQ
jgi:hypothetical protein